MSIRSVLSPRLLALVSAVLVVVIVAISPRALLAPSLSFNRAQESKRPKTPKNVVRTNPAHTSNSERPGKAPKPAPDSVALRESPDLRGTQIAPTQVPARAFQELSKPEYLKLFGASPPGARLAPPA